MATKKYTESQLPIRKTSELLPQVFRSEANDKFLSGTLDALTQPGVLNKLVGYVGKRYGKTYKGEDFYVDTNETLRSRYQLEPGVVREVNGDVEGFTDYLDFKNILNYFGNTEEQDNKTTEAKHYAWNPPIDWDKFINFRQYYWTPAGPPPITIQGQAQSVISTYTVKPGLTSTWIFYPDGLTNNPTVKLYRGQTYKFNVNAPGDGFAIRTSYDTGSLLFSSSKAYETGSTVLYVGKLYTAVNDVPLGSSFNLSDWTEIDSNEVDTVLDYNNGVVNNGIEQGVITFTVPFDSPDILYYQSISNPDRLGQFIIDDIESNSIIDVELEILGKVNYTSSNNIELSNGMVIRFLGTVTPTQYANDNWLVEGVGTGIKLTKFTDLVIPPTINSTAPDVVFDNAGFDTEPFDDATTYPSAKDYLTIAKSSVDRNPWSRYNRWFHKSVLEQAHAFNGSTFDAREILRAKRPIIEFQADLQLFNHGGTAKANVDFLDNFTTDVFSTIEGTSGYNIDNETIFEGARILFTADTDNLVKNKIFQVRFIVHNGVKQIHLSETEDSDPQEGEGVLVRYGQTNGGIMYHYNGLSWVQSQTKTSVNQPPLFDVFDNTGISFANEDIYPVSTFNGTELISYKQGSAINDTELGFPISYLNINNVGDIEFEFDFDKDLFSYLINRSTVSKKINSGFLKFNNQKNYDNTWQLANTTYHQAIVDSVIVTENTNTVNLQTVDWNQITDDQIFVFVNGFKQKTGFVRTLGTFVFDTALKENDVVSVKIFADVDPDRGYYEIPIGLERNPLNQDITEFTLGTVVDHVQSALEFDERLESIYYDDTNFVVGNNNLRDIGNYEQNFRRFVKHSGLNILALSLLTDKNVNLIKSLEYAKHAYKEFKNDFLVKASELQYNLDPIAFVDEIMTQLTRSKNINNAFAYSDMIGTGAFTELKYEVEDTGIKTFVLSESFDLSTASDRAVYVYLNGEQLLNKKDYQFESNFAFVTLNVELTEGDVISIKEYVSTASCFIPATPTKLGLYKKYEPIKFLDTTFVEPRQMIQGHDGSLYAAFDDYRDDILIELEKRIYNNIKQSYDENILDLDSLFDNYYGAGEFSKTAVDRILNRQFLNWANDTTLDYTNNTFFDSENSLTFTYSNMTDPTGTINLPGYWRGVYRWFYGTDRPHTRPWEMLGFSEEPVWWQTRYGVAPYTKGNLVLWEDLENGIIREGDRSGTYEKYKRPGLTLHIPVDFDGNLTSPLESGLANNFTLINNRGDFKFGDVSPVESAWRYSSDYPYAAIIAASLLKPFDVISENLDRLNTSKNILNQTVSNNTQVFKTLSEINVPRVSTSFFATAGLINYITDYRKGQGATPQTLQDFINNTNVRLSHRLSGFVDKDKLKFVLDSKNPRSESSSVFVPDENYQIYFNTSSPIEKITYSGVIIEKTSNGFKVLGYDRINPYFEYYKAVPAQADPLISVGGVSENFVIWTENKFYANGVIVEYQNRYYRANKSHTSGETFDLGNWAELPKLPITGGVDALKRRNFNKNKVNVLPYGTVFTNVQSVIDFLLGYEQYLISQGFVFDEYDSELQVVNDWFGTTKEFMFWTGHNWNTGAIISLSPSASKIKIRYPVGTAENIFNNFFDYGVFKSDGTSLDPQFIDVNRSFQTLEVSCNLENDGIYYLGINYVLKEHVVVFDDRTVFNDVIYDKNSGYRQERIKLRGFRTTDWDGDYTSPGFIFDNVNIQSWQPYTDYRLGDIVSYKEFYWTNLQNQTGTEEFDDTRWTKLDLIPKKELIPNFDYKINQFEDYFNLDSDGVVGSQRDLAKHMFGYQTRTYLNNLSQDDVTQFKLYQGFIREKGTRNSVTKVFEKLSNAGQSNIEIKEQWAFKTGEYGGNSTVNEIEFNIKLSEFELNPQPALVQESDNLGTILDPYIRITPNNFNLALTPFSKDIFPIKNYVGLSRNAGYVNINNVEFITKDVDSLLELNIFNFRENDHVWITFYKNDWTVWRFVRSDVLYITSIEDAGDIITITFNRSHNYSINDVIGIKQIPGLNGFHKIVSTGFKTIVIEVDSPEYDYDESTIVRIFEFASARFTSYNTVNPEEIALLNNESKLWIDDNGNDKWEVIEKRKNYSAVNIFNYGITAPENTGYSVKYADELKQSIVGIPRSNFVIAYARSSNGLVVNQIISASSAYTSFLGNSFGREIALSPDNRYMAVGVPFASGVPTQFRGSYRGGFVAYNANDVVLHDGQLWKAKQSQQAGDGSSILNFNTDDWELAKNIPVNTTSSLFESFSNQGLVIVFKYEFQRWDFDAAFISPRPAINEQFGRTISIAQDNDSYSLAVSAPNSYSNTGRVYLYENINGNWEFQHNSRYSGIYDPTGATFYPAGSIVWAENNLYEAQVDTQGDGSSITLQNEQWAEIDPVSTNVSLPTTLAYQIDGSSLPEALLTDDQIAELIKEGDEFGTSIAFNTTGSILAIGAPFSDQQYFENFKGYWNSLTEYTENDVVKYNNQYYRLTDPESTDSTIVSKNQNPESLPWISVGDSTSQMSGKVFIYQKQPQGYYKLLQTISSNSIASINETGTAEIIELGDLFGRSLDVDGSGNTLIVAAPQSDINFQDQGSVYIFKNTNTENPEYKLIQKIQSYENYVSEYFGSSVSISKNTDKIAIGAENSKYVLSTTFDNEIGTSFDQGFTQFIEERGYPGQVYVFERKVDRYFLAEKLEAEFIDNESFGFSVDCTSDLILVGSPNYTVDGSPIGNVRLFVNNSEKSIDVIATKNNLTDIDRVENISLYDFENNLKVADVDIIDFYKLKLPGIVEQELSFKTMYDPAIYNVGTDNVNVDSNQAWLGKNIGKLWWDISKAKWLNYEQGDIAYRSTQWNRQVEGSEIKVYEWVESKLLPSEWSLLADTTEGLPSGISGQPLYPDDSVYSQKVLFNTETGLPSRTLYYYWVESKSTVPNLQQRRLSATDVRRYIENPIVSGLPFIALIDSDKFAMYNFESYITNDNTHINFLFKNNEKRLPVHKEYHLLEENVSTSLPNSVFETKWIDSLIGYDIQNNQVPDSSLPVKQRYGIESRPRQTLFVDRKQALKIVIERINLILQQQPFAETISFSKLNDAEAPPGEAFKLYDLTVDSFADLQTLNSIRLQNAKASANLINGKIDTIDITNRGLGYRVEPTITISGTGEGATAETVINTQGRVTSASVITPGKKYSEVNVIIRPFSVLVQADETASGFWSIYAWDDVRREFFRSRTQAYDVKQYWKYIDWWAPGYSQDSNIVAEIQNYALEPTVNLETGDLLRVKEFGTSGWIVLEKTNEVSNFSDRYKIVGRQNGTIQFLETLYNSDLFYLGYDQNTSFDTLEYDKQPNVELRKIFELVKNDIFLNDYAVEWNKLFFASMRYAFSEQPFIDWAFKTSFINVVHTVGDLEQTVSFKDDSLDSYIEYLNEVKPYRTTIREFTSKYNKVDTERTAMTDFDLPSIYSVSEGKIIPINQTKAQIDQYPWKWWADNNGFEIESIQLANAGSGYTSSPRVVIDGTGSGAEAKAFITNGSVTAIQVIKSGNGYTSGTTVTLVGGNGSNSNIARAVPILGNSSVRTFDTTIKFDRISKTGLYQNLNQTQTFIASGSSAVFDLAYAPSRDKTQINIKKNNQFVLNSEYAVTLFLQKTGSYTQLKGKIIFVEVPAAGDVIAISYIKNDSLLDSVNRINKLYNPTSGMKGNELDQLMTGVDYGGVQIQGTTFDVTGGWDALPWFTDNWDSVESNSDFFYVADGSTTNITLPFTPEAGQIISIYLKRVDDGLQPTIDDLQFSVVPEDPKTVRIDDPYWNLYDGSTVQPNGRVLPLSTSLMPTFIGDGSTNTIEIGDYVRTYSGDTLIFRTVDSDGTVTINDNNIIDTNLSGGDLTFAGGAYSTANGSTPEEITVDGDKFVSPDNSPAPEENLPGQVLESLSIKVFHKQNEGTAPISSQIYIGNALTVNFDIGIDFVEENSVIVIVNANVQQANSDYTIDYSNNRIVFSTPPQDNDVIEIVSVGIGGVGILDYQEYNADGETKTYASKAVFADVTDVLVTVDGIEVDATFEESTEILGRTSVTLVSLPAKNATVKVLSFSQTTDSRLGLFRVNNETITLDGSTRIYDLTGFVYDDNASVLASVLPSINDRVLIGPDTIIEVYNGINNNIVIGVDPEELAGSITSANIKVFVNDVLQQYVLDYVFDGNQNLITILSANLTLGDIIKIETNVRAEYEIVDNTIILDTALSISDGDILQVTWYNEYASADIISDEYVGGQVKYDLQRRPIDVNFVWVYLNGQRLTKDLDWYIDDTLTSVYLKDLTTTQDNVKIIVFGTTQFSFLTAYELHKDMLNRYFFKRYSISQEVQLAKDLQYYDTAIEITNASNLFEPELEKNLPGIVEINGERIEYFVKQGNVLSQLRRGAFGTGIAQTHKTGSSVADVSSSETIPYNETQEKETFVSDGSSLLIGPLSFVPGKTEISTWYRETIPSEYGQGNDVEVFVGGRRLRKTPVNIYNETLGDIGNQNNTSNVEAEFSVDGTGAYIRLTEPPSAGVRVFVIRKQGSSWYDKGQTTVTAGITLLENNTTVAKFIRQKSTELPE